MSDKANQELLVLKQRLKTQITQLLEQGRTAEADAIVNQYMTIDSTDPDIYTHKGIIHFMQGDLSAAESKFQEGIVLDGNHFDLLYNLGFVNEQQGDLRRAVRYYQRALNNCTDDELRIQLEAAIERLTTEGWEVADDRSKKKVLIIAHIFPPVGGSGVQRTLKFVKYIREFGWEPIVVTVGTTKYPLMDPTLIKEVPEDLKIIRVDEPPLNDVQALAAELKPFYQQFVNNREIIGEWWQSVQSRGSFDLYPDAYIMWGLYVLQTLPSVVDMDDIDLFYSTSGPYTDHVIGCMLKERFDKPWVADFRDEWTHNAYANYDQNSVVYKMRYAMEERIVREADHVLTTTPLSSSNYVRHFHLNVDKVTTITNGYDEEDFSELQEDTKSSDKFTVFHNGLLYSIRTPVTFFEAISNLIKKKKIKSSDLHIGFAWTEEEEQWKQIAKNLDIGDIVHFYGYLSHKDSLIKATEADLLLLILGPGEKNKAVYPGKIFEYLRLRKPILSLAPHDSLVDQLVEETERGRNAEFADVEEIEAAFLAMYNEWKERQWNNRLQLDDRVSRYDRKVLTESLAGTFNRIYVNHRSKLNQKKIVFFSIKDGDRFLDDIITRLNESFNVRKVIVTDLKQVDEGMKWADICWFEWCDQVFAYGSKLPMSREKKIVCRLHSYEAFTNNVSNVEWNNVDKLILVSNGIKRLLESKHPQLFERVQTHVILNGVNISAFEYIKRQPGYNIAFVGYMIPHKNPMLLLQFARKLIDLDNRYHIYIAGEFRDDKLKLYWDYQLDELGLQNNVHFQGYQPNINEWLIDKNYLVSMTMFESFGYGIAEAMASGIKPVIHNFPFSKEIWPEKFLFNTIEEAIASVQSNEYDSMEYRDYIQAHFSLERQIRETIELLESLESETRDKTLAEFMYKEEKVRFYLPQMQDYIQRTIYQKRQFYEQPMLEYMMNRGLQNKTIVDIGANIGNHTVFFSKVGKAKKVFCFEPYLPVFEILERNIEINGISEMVKPYPIALGEKKGQGSLQVRDSSNLGMNKVDPNGKGTVDIRTLDEMNESESWKSVDVIKVDVEGMAYEVLKGGLKMIQEHGPILYVEAETESELDSLIQLLSPLGYEVKARFNSTPTYLFEKK